MYSFERVVIGYFLHVDKLVMIDKKNFNCSNDHQVATVLF